MEIEHACLGKLTTGRNHSSTIHDPAIVREWATVNVAFQPKERVGKGNWCPNDLVDSKRSVFYDMAQNRST